jgi:AcrR family transcriptional regulator
LTQKSFTRNKQEKIRLILTTFADLVNKNGYDSLSTRHIAKAAGISVGTIYYYFPEGKHDIASHYIDYVTDELFDPNIFQLGEKSLQEFFKKLIQRYLNVHKKNFEIHKAIDQAILADPVVHRQNKDAIKLSISKVVTELRQLGLYSSIKEPVVLKNFMLLFNVLEGLIHRHLFIHPLFENDEELISFLVLLMEYITNKAITFQQ